ncbi:MAG: AEC family transporter [Betaproteobacteria bacterium]|nr:AEC family transporter [Betaproteobacteria bacterium]
MAAYFSQLFNLMVEVMLPLGLLVAIGGLWPRFFPDTPVDGARTLLNRMVMYLFLPSILFSVASSTPVSADLLSVPLLVGIGSLVSGLILYVVMYRTPVGRGLADSTRAILVVGGMFGNTFNIGVPVLIFFFGRDATRYAVFNDMLMTMPLVWSIGVLICTRLGAHDDAGRSSVWRIMLSMPPIWAFILGITSQQLGLTYAPLVKATWFIGQATIPVTLFVLGMTIPWRNLTPRPEILSAALVKLIATPVIAWLAARTFYVPMAEAQYAAVVEAATPAMVTTLLLADRFRLDSAAAALLIGWTTILFWLTLPLIMALGLIR